jgi:hypothetical protein
MEKVIGSRQTAIQQAKGEILAKKSMTIDFEKVMFKVKTFPSIKSGLISIVKPQTNLKSIQSTLLKNELKSRLNVGQTTNLMEATIFKIIPTTRTNTIEEVINRLETTQVTTPTFNIPPFSGGAFFFPPIDFGGGSVPRKRKKRYKNQELLGILPDFTSRIAGIEPEEVNVNQAVNKILQTQTGFEVRRGIRIKELGDDTSILKLALKKM